MGNKSSGGISALQTKRGLRLYHVSYSELYILTDLDNKGRWILEWTGIKVHAKSSLSCHTPMVEGAHADPVCLFVSPDGKLQEAGENQATKKWEISTSSPSFHRLRQLCGIAYELPQGHAGQFQTPSSRTLFLEVTWVYVLFANGNVVLQLEP